MSMYFVVSFWVLTVLPNSITIKNAMHNMQPCIFKSRSKITNNDCYTWYYNIKCSAIRLNTLYSLLFWINKNNALSMITIFIIHWLHSQPTKSGILMYILSKEFSHVKGLCQTEKNGRQYITNDTLLLLYD